MKEKIKINDIISWTNSEIVSGDIEKYIVNISTDSRTIKKGNFFVPLTGENYNGHEFIESALDKGACGFVFEKAYRVKIESWKKKAGNGDFKNLVILQSGSILDFLKSIAYNYIRKFKPVVIGITGSAGKTTTKDFLANILGREHRVVFTPRNYNTEIGVSKSILEIGKNTDFFIAELGMRGKGQIKILSDICNLNLGAITVVGQSHMAFFKDLREIAMAKAEVAEILYKNNGTLFLNNDDGYGNFIEKSVNCRVEKFGRNSNISFNFVEEKMDDLGRFTFDFFKNDKKIINISLNISGYHNIYNACCAAAISLYSGISSKAIKEGIEGAVIEGSRMEILKRKDRMILDDCYNANPLSVKGAIDSLVLISKKKNVRSVALLGDMLELGRSSNRLHQEIGEYLSGKKVDVLIAVGTLARKIYEGFRGKSSFSKNDSSCFYFSNKEELSVKINDLLEPGDLILVKGSRANKMEDIINLI
ncbi:MAG TPA: UDP-N-acetylmuramoyl-tripeptide--D-alanyl-D-alanine ligase [Candidatus Humimicrobiaceae bacterium]